MDFSLVTTDERLRSNEQFAGYFWINLSDTYNDVQKAALCHSVTDSSADHVNLHTSLVTDRGSLRIDDGTNLS